MMNEEQRGGPLHFRQAGDVQDGQGTGHVSFDALPFLAVPCRPMALFDPAGHLPEHLAWSLALTERSSRFLARAEGLAEGLEALRLMAKAEAMAEELGISAAGSEEEYGPLPGATTPVFPNVDTVGLGLVGNLPPLPLNLAVKVNPKLSLIPREEDCYALWDRYLMPDHIREHSQHVADMAGGIADLAREKGMNVNPDLVYAAGLLHDLAKAYCIAHGGNHAQLGAAWVMKETRNGSIARGVLFHVHWPWAEDIEDPGLFLIMSLIYADKRVKHNGYVSLADRLNDLLDRYGRTESAREKIRRANTQGRRIEAALSDRLGVNLDEYTAHSRRLVKRT